MKLVLQFGDVLFWRPRFSRCGPRSENICSNLYEPATDGLAALSQICRYGGLKQLTVAVAHGLKDLAYSL